MGRNRKRKNGHNEAPQHRTYAQYALGAIGMGALGVALGIVAYRSSGAQRPDMPNAPIEARHASKNGRQDAPASKNGRQDAPRFEVRPVDLRSLPVTFTDKRGDPKNMSNASAQTLLADAYRAIQGQRIPKEVGMPVRLEVILHSIDNKHEMLEGQPADYDAFVRDATALVEDTRIAMGKTYFYRTPALRFTIATGKDDMKRDIPYKEFLETDITMYVFHKHIATLFGTVRMHGTGRVQFNADITHVQHIAGDVVKHAGIVFKDGKLHPTLSYSPVAHYWSGNTPEALDNVVGEYLHCAVGPRTMQHTADEYAAYINAKGIPRGEGEVQNLFNKIYRKFDLLEEALVHGAAHSVTKKWLKAQGKQQGAFGANYLGVSELEAYCDEVGLAQLLNEYAQQPQALIKRANFRHDAPEQR